MTTSYSDIGGGLWANDKFTCPDAAGRDTTGDYNNYCIFKTVDDTQKACTNDSQCTGYVTGKVGMYQLTRSQPVTNTVANGHFWKKNIVPATTTPIATTTTPTTSTTLTDTTQNTQQSESSGYMYGMIAVLICLCLILVLFLSIGGYYYYNRNVL